MESPNILSRTFRKIMSTIYNLIKFDFKSIAGDQELPSWFIIILGLGLLPILAWPIVVFGSIFLLDNPKNPELTLLYVILMDIYPLYLIGNMLLAIKGFKQSKVFGLLISVLPSTAIVYLALQIFN